MLYEFYDCCVIIRARESELQKRHAEDKAALESSNLSQTQEMVREFSAAQLLLKEKITQLQEMYVIVSVLNCACWSILNYIQLLELVLLFVIQSKDICCPT